MIYREIQRAIITGPTGTIGNALIKRLREAAIEVYAVVRPGSPRVAMLPKDDGIHIIECDASKLERLPALIPNGADALFHLAWGNTIGTGRNDMLSQIDNIRNTIFAARASASLGCKVFVGAGSQAEYGRVDGIIKADTPCFPENGYGMAKLCAGQMSRIESETIGIDHIWIRVLSIYGPHDGPMTMISSTIKTLLEKKKPLLTAGNQKWDYLYCSDAANGLFCAATSGKNGAIYPLGSGTSRPLREYIEIMRDAIDPALHLGFGEISYSAKQVMHLEADISDLQNDTGFYPQVNFETGIRNTIDWLKDNIYCH